MKRFRFSSRGLALMALVLAAVLAAPAARADLLYPGESFVTPDTSALSTFTTQLAGEVTAITPSSGPSNITGFMYSGVLSDGAGDLAFIYQVVLTVPPTNTNVTDVTLNGWAGAGGFGPVGPSGQPAGSAVEAGYSPSLFFLGAGPGTGTPTFMNRQVSGSPIDFLFPTSGSNSIGGAPGAGGTVSKLMYVITKATTWQNVGELVQDGGQATTSGFAPGPEPSSMVLAGMGVLGLVGYGLRRRKAMGA